MRVWLQGCNEEMSTTQRTSTQKLALPSPMTLTPGNLGIELQPSPPLCKLLRAICSTESKFLNFW